MRLLALLLLLTGCGGSAVNECGAIKGQDCGSQMSVTMKYVAASGPCSVTKTMSAEQFYWVVAPAYTPCRVTETSASSAGIDCTTNTVIPAGCNTAACDWQPPAR